MPLLLVFFDPPTHTIENSQRVWVAVEQILVEPRLETLPGPDRALSIWAVLPNPICWFTFVTHIKKAFRAQDRLAHIVNDSIVPIIITNHDSSW